MATQSIVAPRAGTFRLPALVLREHGTPLETVLDAYVRTAEPRGVERSRCECVWPACTTHLDEQIEVTMPLILSGIDPDNAAERWEELQALWDLRWARIMAQPECGTPRPQCRACGGQGSIDEHFFGAYDYYDAIAAGPEAWTGLLRPHRESPPTWAVPRKYAMRFDAYGVSSPGALAAGLPTNPTTVRSLLERCEGGYVPTPALVICPRELHLRLDWETEHEWQLRVWELLLEHASLDATLVRVAIMGKLERSRPRLAIGDVR